MNLVDLDIAIRANLRDPVVLALGMRRAMERVVADIKEKTGQNLSGRIVRIRSGKLLSKLEGTVAEPTEGVVVGTVGVGELGRFYGRFLERGTVTHFIRPKKERGLRSALRFQMAADKIFRKRVRHPGIRPKPFLKPAFDEVQPGIMAIFESEIQPLLDGGDG